MLLTEVQRVKITEELHKTRKEVTDLKEKLNEDISREAQLGFNLTEFSPKQEEILDRLYEKKLMVEGYKELLNGKKVLGTKEECLREKIDDLRKQMTLHQQKLATVAAAQYCILSILSK